MEDELEPELTAVEMVRQKIGESALETMEAIDEELIEAVGQLADPVEHAAQVMLDKGMERPAVMGMLVGVALRVVYG